MSAICGRSNRTTELVLATALRRNGINGWRRHLSLPGRPDFAFRRLKVAVFVDGCFWHGCPKCYKAPRHNTEFWVNKLSANRRRDQRVARQLRSRGWVVVRIWEHSLVDPARVVRRIRSALTRAGLHPSE
ncbi:MAG: DNA mismatch endonuclease Vsr [bacterium]|nr:DNA mismatch endonuclease Vsr [bacterium]